MPYAGATKKEAIEKVLIKIACLAVLQRSELGDTRSPLVWRRKKGGYSYP